jgi:F-type H+-transporting ATPase subunit a
MYDQIRSQRNFFRVSSALRIFSTEYIPTVPLMAHYTYLNEILPFSTEVQQNTQEYLLALGVASLMLFGGGYLASRLRTKGQAAPATATKDYIVPSRKIGAFSLTDFGVEAFVNYHDSIVGKENRKHVPFTATAFFYILIMNFLGLIPGMPASTTTVWINVGLAFSVFLYFNYYGIKEHGVIGYLKHFAGPVWWIAPLFFCLEILSTCMRVLTLNLRLYWNISADHTVVETFVHLFGDWGAHGAAAVFYLLGAFVSFMQAFIFATLTMIYILLATQHEEH